MSITINAKRMVTLLTMAALVAVLSALYAPDAQGKMRHHHKKSPAINVVQCPNQGNDTDCVGTASSDYLVGKDDNFDSIEGREGDDVYDGKGGSDTWEDFSAMSNDR